MKILMVCLGNICRSPLAEGILQSKVSTDTFVDSAGTQAWHSGKHPDMRSIEIAKKFGIDISKQKARQFKVTDFDFFDKIYVMDQSNFKDVCKSAPNDSALDKVQFILNEVTPNTNQEVPDPYYGGVDGFLNVFELLDNACNEIAKNISKNA